MTDYNTITRVYHALVDAHVVSEHGATWAPPRREPVITGRDSIAQQLLREALDAADVV